MGLTEAARSYLGVPFKHQGRNRAGMDCAGLVALASQDAGCPLVDVAKGYSRKPSRGIIESVLATSPNLVRLSARETLRKDDILLFRLSEEPQHLAIFTGTGIIHAYSTAGEVKEHRFVSFWKDRLAAVYRVNAHE